ncbi:MAG: peptidylprolyl isomerase [Gammaproteobacteria bacterium]|nr:peptidylprolyl isomerase [Gammaproteobacteria bacterium]MDH5629130.1 peptidylprolyl isomerase [Gammaproteobacteria bacterium]
MKTISGIINLLLVVVILTPAVFASNNEKDYEKIGSKVQPDNLFPKVKIDTSQGVIVVELNRHKSPISSNNFIGYAVSGLYDDTIFHRIAKDFVIQGGGFDRFNNPRPNGKPIFNESGNGLTNSLYTIAMARTDKPHSATNQFYFNLGENESLNPGKDWGYAVFGDVLEGSEVLDLISQIPIQKKVSLGWDEMPQTQILIKTITMIAEE